MISKILQTRRINIAKDSACFSYFRAFFGGIGSGIFAIIAHRSTKKINVVSFGCRHCFEEEPGLPIIEINN